MLFEHLPILGYATNPHLLWKKIFQQIDACLQHNHAFEAALKVVVIQ